MSTLHPLVRDLYRRVLSTLPHYPHPLGPTHVKSLWKSALQQDRGVHLSEDVIKKKVAKGRYMVREMHALIKLKKYRVMKQRYGDQDKDFDDIQREVEKKGLES